MGEESRVASEESFKVIETREKYRSTSNQAKNNGGKIRGRSSFVETRLC